MRDLDDDAPQRVQELQSGYHRARRRYRTLVGSDPPSFWELERRAYRLYTEQAKHYAAHDEPRYRSGIVPIVLAHLDEHARGPANSRSTRTPGEPLGHGKGQLLKALALYPCLHALSRVSDETGDGLLDAGDDWITQTMDDEDLRQLVLLTRRT